MKPYRQPTPRLFTQTQRGLFVATLLWLVLAAFSVSAQNLAPGRPLRQGHSHNDYWRPRPLADALKLGFKSVEADVFLIGEALLVGHSQSELNPAKTLASLYLDPLLALWQKQGHIYHGKEVLLLYIDIKTAGPATYRQLAPVLQKYAAMLVQPGQRKRKGRLQIILTGNYPTEMVLADPNRLVFLDGKVSDLATGMDPQIYPVVSGNWTSFFKWRGEGAMPAAEKKVLADWARLAQQNGQLIRFWNINEKQPEAVRQIWRELLTYPALLVGTDHLDWLPPAWKKTKKPAH